MASYLPYYFSNRKVMATTMTSSSSKILQSEFKKLQEQPVEGFTIGLVDDCDMFQWKVGLYGPPDTLYAGGYFKVSSS